MRRIGDPNPFSARTKQLRQACSPLSRHPPTCPPFSARLPSPTAPPHASQLAAAVAATVRRVAWPPHTRSLPCRPARARAVPSARHASQSETVLPRGCPALRSGLRTRLGRLGCWLVAARHSRAGSCYCARGGRGRGNSWQLQLWAPELQLQPCALPPAAAECELAKPTCPRRCL